MNSAPQIFQECRKKDVIIEMSGDNLVCDGPENVLTDDFVSNLRANKDSLLHLLDLIETFKAAGWEGTIVSSTGSIPSKINTPTIWCGYKGKPRRVHSEVCRWHREENDPECQGCARIKALI